MVLVFFICLFLVLLITVVILSTISVRIEKFKASNYNKYGKLKIDYKVFFELLFLNKLKIFSIKIDKGVADKLKVKDKLKNIDFQQAKTNMPSKKDFKEIIKKLQIKIDKLNLKLDIGTIDIILTSAIITVLASTIGIVVARLIIFYVLVC